MEMVAKSSGEEKNQRVNGTFISIFSNSITVRAAARNHKIVTVVVTPSTNLVNDGAVSSARDLKVNQEVVIYLKRNGEKLEATTIRFGKQRYMGL